MRFLLVFALLLSTWLFASTTYRYIDSRGNVVLGTSISDEALSRGYQVLDSRGRVIAEVPPRLSNEQQRQLANQERDHALARQRDQELMRLYGEPSDVDRAMRNVTGRAELNISNLQARINERLSRLALHQQEAARQERARSEIDPELLQEIQQVERDIEEFEAEIQDIRNQIAITEQQFRADRDRLQYLLNLEQRRLQEALEAAGHGQ